MSEYNVNNMDGGEKFSLAFIKILAGATVAIATIIGGCNMHIDYRIGKAIESGSDPVLARLAFSEDGDDERLLYIVNKEK